LDVYINSAGTAGAGIGRMKKTGLPGVVAFEFFYKTDLDSQKFKAESSK